MLAVFDAHRQNHRNIVHNVIENLGAHEQTQYEILEITLIFVEEADGDHWSSVIFDYRDVETVCLITKAKWSEVRTKRRRTDNNGGKPLSDVYQQVKYEHLASPPRCSLDEKKLMLEGCACEPQGLTADSANPTHARLPKWLKSLLALHYRTHRVEFVKKIMTDFNVHFVADLAPGHGVWSRACSDLERPCINLTWNTMHTEFATRALDSFLITKMATQGQRLFVSDLKADVHRIYAALFTPLGSCGFASLFVNNKQISLSLALQRSCDDGQLVHLGTAKKIGGGSKVIGDDLSSFSTCRISLGCLKMRHIDGEYI